jgi:hypothetical protein
MGKRTRTLDDSTHASNPGGIRLSQERLRRLRPDLFGWPAARRWLGQVVRGQRVFPIVTHVSEALLHGDGRAAIVMSLEPLLVAAYSGEIGGVAMLRFDSSLVREFQLSLGQRLLTVNTYGKAPQLQEDLIRGPEGRDYWRVLHPLIADFLTDDAAALAARKRELDEEEWQHAEELGRAYLRERPGLWRDGRPIFAGRAAVRGTGNPPGR